MSSGKRGPKYWLFIEPFVMVSLAGEKILFYHTITRARVELALSPIAQRVAGKLTDPSNGYVTGITNTDLKDASLQEMVRQLRLKFMGDLLNVEWSDGKPVNILPDPYFKSALTESFLKTQEAIDSIDFESYIHELVIYLNSQGNEGSDRFQLAPEQFIFPGNTLKEKTEVDWDKLRPFLGDLEPYQVTLIQVSGADPGNYSSLEELSDYIAQSGIHVNYHFTAEQYAPEIIHRLLKNKLSRISLHFTFPLNPETFNSIITDLKSMSNTRKTDFHFLVSSVDELAAAREVIALTHLPKTSLHPFFNGNNFDFFRNTVFITRKDIKNSRPSQNQVFSRIAFNETDFGRITLLPNGSFFANLNNPTLGQLGQATPKDLILNELFHGKSWMLTRKGVDPCKRCLYHFLCPPISSYEILFKRFNFCDVFDNS